MLALHRTGMSPSTAVGEGAVLAVMEPLSAANERGAKVHAVVTGYGTTFEPPADDDRLFAPSQRALERAITMALEDASLATSETDTPKNYEIIPIETWEASEPRFVLRVYPAPSVDTIIETEVARRPLIFKVADLVPPGRSIPIGEFEIDNIILTIAA